MFVSKWAINKQNGKNLTIWHLPTSFGQIIFWLNSSQNQISNVENFEEEQGGLLQLRVQ